MATNKELEKEIKEIKEEVMAAKREGNGSLAMVGKFDVLFSNIRTISDRLSRIELIIHYCKEKWKEEDMIAEMDRLKKEEVNK